MARYGRSQHVRDPGTRNLPGAFHMHLHSSLVHILYASPQKSGMSFMCSLKSLVRLTCVPQEPGAS